MNDTTSGQAMLLKIGDDRRRHRRRVRDRIDSDAKRGRRAEADMTEPHPHYASKDGPLERLRAAAVRGLTPALLVRGKTPTANGLLDANENDGAPATLRQRDGCSTWDCRAFITRLLNSREAKPQPEPRRR